jgi:hypothetical protein
MTRGRVTFLATLYVFFLSAYFITFRGYFYSVDAQTRLEVAESIVREGDFRAAAGWATVPGRNGNYYPVNWLLGQSLTFVPAVVAADVVREAAPGAPAREVEKLVAMTPVVFFAAGAALFTFLIAEAIGFSRGSAFGAAALYAFGTVAWFYSKVSFEATQLTFLILGAVYFLLKARTAAPRRGTFFAGLWLAAALITRKDAALAGVTLTPAVFLAWVFQTAGWRANIKPAVEATLFFLAGPLAAVALTLAFNYWRFGVLFTEQLIAAYPHKAGFGALAAGNIPAGVLGLLIGPGYGLFVFNPVLISGAAALPALVRKNRFLWLWFLAFAGLASIFYAKMLSWTASFGPRYLLPLVPFLAIAAVAFFGSDRVRRRPWLRAAAGGLLVVSALIQLCGVCVPPTRYYVYRLTLGQRYFPDAFRAQESPIIWQPVMLYRVLTSARPYTPPEMPRTAMTDRQYLNTVQMNKLDFYWTLFPAFGYRAVWFYMPLAASAAVCFAALWLVTRRPPAPTGGGRGRRFIRVGS